mmetsp:Transcript_16801/g.39602  ORF Transcript_16801/g.39602 Transcript_16801/m.39602 type:complete len:417 (-) Transcript_16801:7116-8366(-)
MWSPKMVTEAAPVAGTLWAPIEVGLGEWYWYTAAVVPLFLFTVTTPDAGPEADDAGVLQYMDVSDRYCVTSALTSGPDDGWPNRSLGELLTVPNDEPRRVTDEAPVSAAPQGLVPAGVSTGTLYDTDDPVVPGRLNAVTITPVSSAPIGIRPRTEVSDVQRVALQTDLPMRIRCVAARTPMVEPRTVTEVEPVVGTLVAVEAVRLATSKLKADVTEPTRESTVATMTSPGAVGAGMSLQRRVVSEPQVETSHAVPATREVAEDTAEPRLAANMVTEHAPVAGRLTWCMADRIGPWKVKTRVMRSETTPAVTDMPTSLRVPDGLLTTTVESAVHIVACAAWLKAPRTRRARVVYSWRPVLAPSSVKLMLPVAGPLVRTSNLATGPSKLKTAASVWRGRDTEATTRPRLPACADTDRA